MMLIFPDASADPLKVIRGGVLFEGLALEVSKNVERDFHRIVFRTIEVFPDASAEVESPPDIQASRNMTPARGWLSGSGRFVTFSLLFSLLS